MDPYVILMYQGISYKTPVLEEAGKEPVWNYTIPQTFIFPPQKTTGEEEFKLICMEDDIGRDDKLGEAIIRLKDLVGEDVKGVNGKWIEAYTQGE